MGQGSLQRTSEYLLRGPQKPSRQPWVSHSSGEPVIIKGSL